MVTTERRAEIERHIIQLEHAYTYGRQKITGDIFGIIRELLSEPDPPATVEPLSALRDDQTLIHAQLALSALTRGDEQYSDDRGIWRPVRYTLLADLPRILNAVKEGAAR